jgi:hypothetical protein
MSSQSRARRTKAVMASQEKPTIGAIWLLFTRSGVEASSVPSGLVGTSIIVLTRLTCGLAGTLTFALAVTRPGVASSSSTGASTGSGSSSCSSSRRGSTRRRRRRTISHLERENTTKRTSSVIVGNLHQTDARLPVDGARAGRASGDVKGDVKVLVDVCGSLGDDARVLEQGPDVRLLGDAARAVSVSTRHVRDRLGHDAVGESARRRGVDDCLEAATAVRGYDVEDALQLVLDLREGPAAGEFLFYPRELPYLLFVCHEDSPPPPSFPVFGW